MPEEAIGISCDDWQQTSRPAEASAYLQQIAAMPLLREIAARSLAC
jgi:hypothetical protein